MAPEMEALGEEEEEGEGPKTPVGTACDMYSLGQTVCILLTGPDSDDASGGQRHHHQPGPCPDGG